MPTIINIIIFQINGINLNVIKLSLSYLFHCLAMDKTEYFVMGKVVKNFCLHAFLMNIETKGNLKLVIRI